MSEFMQMHINQDEGEEEDGKGARSKNVTKIIPKQLR